MMVLFLLTVAIGLLYLAKYLSDWIDTLEVGDYRDDWWI